VNLPDSSTESNEIDKSGIQIEPTRGLVDVIIEIGRQRQAIFLKMKDAVEKGDRDGVFRCAEELVGLCEPDLENQASN
jgi:hypothetical protein